MRVYNKNKKAFLIFSCLFLLLFIQFGYSYLNSALNINGNIDITKNTWDVHFENVVLSDGSVEATTPATIVDDTTVSFAATFQNQGDYYEFEVDIVNSGTIDAMLSEINKTDLVSSGIEYLDYSVSYVNGDSLNVGDALSSSSSETLKIILKYKDDISSDQVPTEEVSFNISLILNYVQNDETAVGLMSGTVLKFIDIRQPVSYSYNTEYSAVEDTMSSQWNRKTIKKVGYYVDI